MVAMVRRTPVVLVAGLACVAATTFCFVVWLGVTNPTITALTYVLIVFMVATSGRLWAAIATSVVAVLCLNFFFLPPVGTWTVADPQNWVALGTLLIVSLAVSHLSAVARARTVEAVAGRDESTRLFDFSRDVLVVTEDRTTLSALAASLARRFAFDGVVIAVPASQGWEQYHGGTARLAIDEGQLNGVIESARRTREFDAYSRTYSGHQEIQDGGASIWLIPIRLGTRPIGILAVRGGTSGAGVREALAGLVAMAIERAAAFESRREAEVTRQSEALKTALLASIGHDLRTPLTAIRIAASNLQSAPLSSEERFEQTDLILSEVERLTRLFQNILEMARIDAGAVPSETRWVHPSEIVEAARDQVGQALRHHAVAVTISEDVPVQLDPRLTAGALAQILENAAQYTPPGGDITVHATVTHEGLVLKVRDRGPGLSDADLPHVFDRFYRGQAAVARTSGTGMGLWIARGLLAVEQGRVWAENAPDGGAVFTIVVPAARKDAPVEAGSDV